MTSQLNRRQLVLASAGLAAVTMIPARAFAQEATPAPATATDDGIDVPVLEVAFTAGGVTATPEVPAGTVRMLASSDGTDDQGILLFRVPDDQDIDEILALAVSETPPPDWFWSTTFPGSVRNDAHVPSVAEGFIVLDPGAYILLDDFVHSAALIIATGEAGAPIDIPATLHVVAEDSMTFTGLEEPIPAGRQLWQLENAGELNHDITIFSTPEGATAGDIHGIFEMLFSGATPEGGGDPFEGYGESNPMSTSWLSGGRSNWFYLDLEPGSYAAMCTAGDAEESLPHFMMGMIVTFTVI
ncbi:MAG: hypothetical protein KC438_08255 [Thermomicrobiales bacterium]|nr:hypothetical protein [Thermomicrobiales bacterium]MCO5220434.1 hypothetical protein [Thermomicrobiales bacterium]